jgi:hypothetical protein
MNQAKKARRMPGVKKLHQEFENSPKAEFILCHLFGAIGILIGTPQNGFCLPFFMNLHDGVKTIFGWSALSKLQESMLYKWVNRDLLPPKHMERPYSCWIRYFLFLPVMKLLNELNASETAEMDIVSNAESHAMIY